MGSLNDSLGNIRLCNEKIQKENMAIKNNVNRISTLFGEMEVDKDNIQKYTDKIEKAIGKIETNDKGDLLDKNINNGEKEKKKNYTNSNKILYYILMFFGYIFLFFSIYFVCIQLDENSDSVFMQFAERYTSDIGYYLAVISAIYTLVLEVQEWFVNRYKKSPNEKLRKMAQNISSMPLLLLTCSMPVLIAIKTFLLFPEWANVICVVTFIMQIKIINHKIKKKEML